jgi:hypothetical protein
MGNGTEMYPEVMKVRTKTFAKQIILLLKDQNQSAICIPQSAIHKVCL